MMSYDSWMLDFECKQCYTIYQVLRSIEPVGAILIEKELV